MALHARHKLNKVIPNFIFKYYRALEVCRGLMHEFSTMQMILETVLSAAKSHKAERVLEINLEIGELTFLNPEQLRFAFSVLSENTIAKNANLHIKRIQPRIRCSRCGYEGGIKYDGPEYHVLGVPLPLQCIKCGETNVEITSGRECNIKNVKIKLPDKS